MKRLTTAVAAVLGVAALLLGMSLSASADHGGGNAAAGGKANGPLKTLVTAGTITEAEATAVKDALKVAVKAQQAEIRAAHKSARATVLAQLVAAGTITAAVAELIQAGSSELRSAMQAGDLTYAQLAAVRAAMIANRPAKTAMKNVVAAVTAKLVTEGKLTAVKAEAVNAAIAAKVEAQKSKRPGMKSNPGKAGSAGAGHGFKGHGFKGDGSKGEGRKAMRS